MIVAATDGACSGNGQSPEGMPGGWGWVTSDDRQASGGARRTTSNRMELRAVLELLRATDPASVTIQTDSTYVLRIFTVWLAAWRARGWLTSGGGPVKNQDLIEAVVGHLDRRQVNFELVRGHAGHELNERANVLAQAAAVRARARLEREGWVPPGGRTSRSQPRRRRRRRG